jgi:molybdopterin/thiamine biosynthesis adenylyltransferase/rhodanese-related sulfurtransferase
MTRYSRQTILPEFEPNTQDLLSRGKILVVGAGALACPVLSYLTGAGIGTIGIADPDVVALHNLHRQVLYTEDDIHLPKVDCAIQRLSKLNSEVTFNAYQFYINAENALNIAKIYDLIIDCSDNFETRYLLNDVAVLLNIPLVHASILGFEGRLSVFNVTMVNGEKSATYRDLFPEPPEDKTFNCAEAGVIGALPGIMGGMQALEAIKIIGKVGELLVNKMLFFNGLTMNSSYLNFKKSKATQQITHLKSIEMSCTTNKSTMQTVSVIELKEMLDNKSDFMLLDVREPSEYEMGSIPTSFHIPMNSVPDRFSEIPTDKTVIVQCRSGKRSADVIAYLEQNHGHTNLKNLSGGIIAWSNEIDNSVHY